ncbi:unnamed protein product, partial [Allacma fusca]
MQNRLTIVLFVTIIMVGITLGSPPTPGPPIDGGPCKPTKKVLGSLCLPVNYLDKFQAESIDDNILNLACKDEELKEELRSIVPITGHRIAILNAFKAAFKADKLT